MTGDLSITRPLDEVTAAHLDRTFEDRIGPDRDLVCRIHALQHAVTLRPLNIRVRTDGEDIAPRDEIGELLVVAARLEAYLRGDERPDVTFPVRGTDEHIRHVVDELQKVQQRHEKRGVR